MIVRHAASVTMAFALLGCGAKSGLETPPPVRVDGGVPPIDAFSPDARPECLSDLECDDRISCTEDRCIDERCQHQARSEPCNDGVFCNGLERCEPTVGCVSPGRVCDDGVGCTADVCDESVARCVAMPDDSLCPVSFRCDVPRGCLARALVHDSSTLFEIDLPSGELRRVGMFPVSLNDIALAPDGTFYGASTEVGGLVRVDYVSVTYEIVAPVFGSFNALDVGPDGTLYGAADDVVYAFDLASGAAREVARLPPGLLSSGDLAFVEGRLYVSAFRDVADLDDTLVGVDLGSGRSVAIGRIGHDCVWALAPLGPTLYGLTCNGQLLELDLGTGRGRELSVRPEQSYWGAASR